jgi:hypothetical protein
MGEFKTEFVFGMIQLENYVFGRTSFKVYDHSLLGHAKVIFLRKSERQQAQIANTNDDDEDPCELIEIWHDPTEEECHCSGDEYFTGRYMYSGECFGTPEYYTIPRSGGGSMTLPFLGGSGGPNLPPYLSTFTEKLNYLLDNLDMTPESTDFLTSSETAVNEMYSYLSNGVSEDRIGIASEHIQKLAGDGDYLSFVAGYRLSTGNSLTAWWDNQTWLSDPANFHLDVTQANGQRDRLTQAEKVLIVLYPVQAYVIHKNVAVARSMTTSMNLPDIVNGKQDAFRHAFFQAINVRDVHPKFGGQLSLSSVEIVSLFALAHESEVHPGLRLEVEMDMFNNNVGIRACLFCLSQSNSFIASAMMAKLNNGELKHIKPLDLGASPYYDANNDGVQDCNYCWNGLISTSILLPTNQ